MSRLVAPVMFGIVVGAAFSACAEVHVTGGIGEATVEAHAATLTEVVAALGNQTGIAIDIVGTDAQPVDGTFAGSAKEILSDVLRNTSFLISDVGDGKQPHLRITVFGPKSSSPLPAKTAP